MMKSCLAKTLYVWPCHPRSSSALANFPLSTTCINMTTHTENHIDQKQVHTKEPAHRAAPNNTILIRLSGLGASVYKIKCDWKPPYFRKLQDYNSWIERTHTHKTHSIYLKT